MKEKIGRDPTMDISKPPYPQEVEHLVDAVLDGVGHTDPRLRQEVEAFSARLSGAQRKPVEIVPGLADYLAKIAWTPFDITDEDILSLKTDGFSEDAIFEITVSAALGAGLARLEKLAELMGESGETGNPARQE